MSHPWPYPGSRWWKFDFHTHTPASKDTPAWQNAIGTSEEITPDMFLLKYMVAGIDCVAITDHNSGAWIDRLKDAYAQMQANPPSGFSEIHLFPGVEISVQSGFHLLAIFDKNATTGDIDTLLGKVDYDGTKGDSDGVTRKGVAEVVQAVLDAGALPIPAHVDREKGMLQVRPGTNAGHLDANTMWQVIEHPGILGMELVDSQASLPTEFTKTKTHWARILGSDCHNFRGDVTPGSRYTWVKMANPTLEGLRLALLDGDGISIQRSDGEMFEPYRLPGHFILSIEIDNARFMGNGRPERLEFTPYYNALIGGRGTGKSTMVHALRLAYRRDEDLKRFAAEAGPLKVFESFRKSAKGRDDSEGALRDSTEIRVVVTRDDVWHCLRWRADGQGTVVEEYNGQDWKPSTSQAVTKERFPLRLFSQGQIVAMAGDNRQALLDVIDTAAGIDRHKQVFAEVKRGYFSLRARLRELEGRIPGREEVQRRLDDVLRKLEMLAQSHHTEVLKAHQRAIRQRREVQVLLEQAEQWPLQVSGLVEGLTLDDWPQGVFDAQVDADILAWRKTIEQTLGQLRQRLADSASQLAEDIGATRRDERLTAWGTRTDHAQHAYEELQAMLSSQGVQDPQEFGRLVQQRQQLEEELKRFDQWQQDRVALLAQFETQWRLLLDVRHSITEARKTFLTRHLAGNRFVRIAVEPFGFDARVLERSLRELLDVVDDRFESDILVLEQGEPSGGLIHQYLQAVDRLSGLEAIKRSLVEFPADLGGHFRNFLQRQLERQPEFADHIHCWFPEDDLKIEYSRSGDGKDFTSIVQGSAGQRAAALLAFLLAFGDEPLVLDQPEDDLDNHHIYDLIVKQIRENKRRRQLIIVTHNPNIVVNGDAEMVHAFNFGSGQCFVLEKGALQEKPVREEVCRIMEGGHEAFQRRWARLGREV